MTHPAQSTRFVLFLVRVVLLFVLIFRMRDTTALFWVIFPSLIGSPFLMFNSVVTGFIPVRIRLARLLRFCLKLREKRRRHVSNLIFGEMKVSAIASQRNPPNSTHVYFGAVVQADFPAQMDVLRWILKDTSYLAAYILHDKDLYTAEEISEKSGGDSVKRVNADGTESEFRAGDTKPAHFHLLLKVQKKMRGSSLGNRFCNQLHFEGLSDAASYARYMTHSTFDARKKHQYKVEEVRFSECTESQSKTMYNALYAGFGGGVIDTVERICTHRAEIAASGAAEPQKELVRALCSAGDVEGLSSLMSHAYFFKEFT